MGIVTLVSMIMNARNAGPGSWWFFGLLLSLFCLAPQFAVADLSPNDVLVLYNADSADSRDIANYYAQKRPGVRLLGLTGVTTAEEVSADYYLSHIRPQVLSALDDSVDVIVTTKGLPLRIRVEQSNPNTYTDPFGSPRTIGPWSWKRYSSLESELTRIDSISTWQQMGDQSTNFTPNPIFAMNPYYWQSNSFTNDQYGIRLASRLDGFTVSDVRGMIDRAAEAYIAPSGPNTPFHVVVDDSPNAVSSFADSMERLRDFVLEPRGMSYTYDGTSDFIQSPAVANPASTLVLGYVSHGVHGGAPRDYLTDPVDGVQFQLANGSVFASWESYNAKTFSPSVSITQGLIAQWIARGGTAGIGHVAEPTATTITVAREDALFDRLLGGMSWVEAAWGATYQLSYVNTVVGDPLMRFQVLLPGDYNDDGFVDSADYVVWRKTNDSQDEYETWRAHFGQTASGTAFGDYNDDGTVDAADYVMWRKFKNTGTKLPNDPYLLPIDGDQYNQWRTHFGETGGVGSVASAKATAPEPATFVMLMLAAAGCCVLRRPAA
jgi:uncharacterized protein (TIGR03790 family)